MKIPDDKINDLGNLSAKYWSDKKLAWLIDLEDFQQEVFLRVLQNKYEYDEEIGSWGSYIYHESSRVHVEKLTRHFRAKRNNGEFCLSLDREFTSGKNSHAIRGEHNESIEWAILKNIPCGKAEFTKKLPEYIKCENGKYINSGKHRKVHFDIGISWDEFVELLAGYEIKEIAEILAKSRETIYQFRRYLIEQIFGKDALKRRHRHKKR